MEGETVVHSISADGLQIGRGRSEGMARQTAIALSGIIRSTISALTWAAFCASDRLSYHRYWDLSATLLITFLLTDLPDPSTDREAFDEFIDQCVFAGYNVMESLP